MISKDGAVAPSERLLLSRGWGLWEPPHDSKQALDSGPAQAFLSEICMFSLFLFVFYLLIFYPICVPTFLHLKWGPLGTAGDPPPPEILLLLISSLFLLTCAHFLCYPIHQASIASDKSSHTHPVNITMFASWILPLNAIHVQLL